MAGTVGLEWLGWSREWARTAASYAGWGLPGRLTGRVGAGVFGVICADGIVRASLGGRALAGLATDPDSAPCPGDWVLVRHWPDGPRTVEQVLPRHNLIRTRDLCRDGTARPVAANVDLVALVVPGAVGSGAPTASLRDWLVAGRAAGARTTLVAVGWQGPTAPLVLAASRDGGWRVSAPTAPVRAGWWAPAGQTALVVGAPGLRRSLTRAVAPSVLGPVAAVPGGGLLIDAGGP